MLTMWVPKPKVTSEGILGGCAVFPVSIKLCGGGGCFLISQQSTAWPYSVNGRDCYCESLPWNLKITRDVGGASGAKPTGFIACFFSGVFIPRDHKVGS